MTVCSPCSILTRHLPSFLFSDEETEARRCGSSRQRSDTQSLLGLNERITSRAAVCCPGLHTLRLPSVSPRATQVSRPWPAGGAALTAASFLSSSSRLPGHLHPAPGGLFPAPVTPHRIAWPDHVAAPTSSGCVCVSVIL